MRSAAPAKVPAVIYGDNKPPLAITPCPTRKSHLRIHAGGFLTTIATIDVDGEKHQVLPKDFQMDRCATSPCMSTSCAVGKNTIVTVEIPVHFLNEESSPGIKRWRRSQHRPVCGRVHLSRQRHSRSVRD